MRGRWGGLALHLVRDGGGEGEGRWVQYCGGGSGSGRRREAG